MKRAVLCVSDPHNYIDQLHNYSIMIVNPDSPESRIQYLLNQSDYSLLITNNSYQERDGNDYPNEKLLWYTSGTVSDSKFYSFTQTQLDALTTSICNDYKISANDRYVGIMGLWHAHGQALYWATKRVNCETHFKSIKELKSITEHRPTFVSAIPHVLKAIHLLPLDSLRFIRSGSAPLSKELYTALQNKFQVPVVEYFGMTEAMSHVFTNPLDGEQRIRTVGLPTQGVNAQIKNGHLWLQSSQAYTIDWFDTGDLAEQDQQGYYRILGRSIDRINVKGYKFDPVSLESQLIQLLPEVENCVIFGQEKINCLYTGSATKDQIRSVLRKIHQYCQVDFLNYTESIPLSPSGKISRPWLKEKFNCR
jgi:oxalate---CoA ligase